MVYSTVIPRNCQQIKPFPYFVLFCHFKQKLSNLVLPFFQIFCYNYSILQKMTYERELTKDEISRSFSEASLQKITFFREFLPENE